jgi:hypothetical protein
MSRSLSSSVKRPEQKHIDQPEVKVAWIKLWQVIAATIITVIGGIVGAVLQSSFGKNESSNHVSQIELLKKENEQLNEKLKRNEAAGRERTTAILNERNALYQITADRLQSSLGLTSAKVDDAKNTDVVDINYKRVKLAVFKNMYTLHADESITDMTLQQLTKRGFAWVSQVKPRLLTEFSDIRVMRLRWLEDKAIPSLRGEIEKAKQSNSPSQSGDRAWVEFPRDVWILSQQQADAPGESVFSISDLEHEAKLIKDKLTENK